RLAGGTAGRSARDGVVHRQPGQGRRGAGDPELQRRVRVRRDHGTRLMATVLKLGGELLDDQAAVRSAAAAIVRLAARTPLVVVHGGGRAIDAELRARGNTPAFVDGLRITDAAALDAVVAVLAGRTNTHLVAAVGAAGARAV